MEYTKWTQIKVTSKVESLDDVTAVMSMVTNSLMIEDYSDAERELVRFEANDAGGGVDRDVARSAQAVEGRGRDARGAAAHGRDQAARTDLRDVGVAGGIGDARGSRAA